MDRQSPVGRIAAAVSAFAKCHVPEAKRWCVALSGGADSLALTAGAAAVLPTVALVVDHGLQPGSAAVAGKARAHALELGCVDAQVLTVKVGTAGGPEAAARTARYEALQQARDHAPVLIGHTLDDQAETVLMGLGRGSGPRSIAGIRSWDPPWGRPLLHLRRHDTEAACQELGLTPWQDPHNIDSRFTRSRLRIEVLPLLEDILGGGVAPALARTAAALQEDGDVLDALAEQIWLDVRSDRLPVDAVADHPAAVRRRVLRRWLLAGGAVGLTDKQIRAVDALVTTWHGQGGVAVPSRLRDQRLFAGRRDGHLVLYREPVRPSGQI
ncbi:tRNA lysidine(34) synthetase TilS [Mycobacterium sp. MS1601]|uniref:tRNA lysidine(34) synthetase TilS n=1 Tax=Mycobacterium sp. MS1601 TaxID=1936029 RepID=UPI0009790FCD|nr:tRNA lysidine(34) synthetase TilS [Mycobacterium sp. MS1601]AQA02668.1 tRNA lysidine(34) synthetase TilS [Mycobacterium sp. MS1601]